MKILIAFAFCWITAFSFAQNIKFNIITSGDYSQSEYTYPGGNLAEHIDAKLPLGFSIGLQAEWMFSKKFSVYSGLTYQQKNFFPRLGLGGPYGPVIDPTGTLNSILSPYLKQHQFQLLSIPVGLKFQPWSFKRINPFVSLGVDASFRFSESEIYQDIWENEEWFKEFKKEDIAIKDNEFAYFGTTINLGIGLSIKITERFSLLLNHQMSLVEFRAANEKFKKNGSMLFEASVLTISQISFGVGAQYSF